MNIESIMNDSSFNKISDEIGNIKTLVYTKQAGTIYNRYYGYNITYIKFIDEKIYVMGMLANREFTLSNIVLFESIKGRKEFVNELKQIDYKDWVLEDGKDNIWGIKISTNNKLYDFTNLYPSPGLEFENMISDTYSSVTRLKEFFIKGNIKEVNIENLLNDFSNEKRIAFPKEIKKLKFNKDIMPLDEETKIIMEENQFFFKKIFPKINLYPIELVNGKNVHYNIKNSFIISNKEYSRGLESIMNDNYKMAALHFMKSIELSNDSIDPILNLVVMFDKGYINENDCPMINDYIKIIDEKCPEMREPNVMLGGMGVIIDDWNG